MGASLVLVAVAVVGCSQWRGSRARRFIGLIAAGMALGTLGISSMLDCSIEWYPYRIRCWGG